MATCSELCSVKSPGRRAVDEDARREERRPARSPSVGEVADPPGCLPLGGGSGGLRFSYFTGGEGEVRVI
jgi:hypothetical protein